VGRGGMYRSFVSIEAEDEEEEEDRDTGSRDRAGV
jgi:hypothetical protein